MLPCFPPSARRALYQPVQAARPKIIDCLKGYSPALFMADLGAGVTVGIVALPLAIGFGIASGVTPAQGLWTAIIAGLIISLLGGSRVQIGGPTGAFVPILSGIVAMYGYSGLALATVMAGVFLVTMGVCKAGNLIKFIPYPVIAGFTSGIAVIIFTGQLKEFLGLSIKMPRHTPEQMAAVVTHLAEANWRAVAMGAIALACLLLWPRKWRAVPPSIIAVMVPTLLVWLLKLNVHTIGSEFGGIPSGLPRLQMPAFSFQEIHELMIPAMTIAMLGAIESLLSAMVADGMIGDRHDSNQELVAQGIANIACPLFGGIPATGAIARTATNIRSGGRTPVAGIIHSITLLVVVLVAAPLAQDIPLASLSAVLFVVAYKMGEWDNFPELARTTRSDFSVLLITFGLTVFFDLTVAVGAGLAIAITLFVRRMEEIAQVRLVTPETDLEMGGDSIRRQEIPEGVLVFRIEGPFFFGVAEKLEYALERSRAVPRVLIFRVRNVPAMDASGLRALEHAWEKFRRRNTHVVLSGVQPQPMKILLRSGLLDRIELENICANLDEALTRARAILAADPAP